MAEAPRERGGVRQGAAPFWRLFPAVVLPGFWSGFPCMPTLRAPSPLSCLLRLAVRASVSAFRGFLSRFAMSAPLLAVFKTPVTLSWLVFFYTVLVFFSPHGNKPAALL